MDVYLDEVLNTLHNFFMRKVPMFLAPYFLYFYVTILNFLEKVKVQFYKTQLAIQSSFSEEFLGFIKTSQDTYFPFLMNSSIKYSCDPVWIYNPSEKLFTFSELGHHASNRHLPFIGASVAFGNQTIGDLSDWLMEQQVHAPDSTIPLQVLVSAWRYYYDNTFMYSYKDYTITVITEDGDERVFNLENEDELIPDGHSTPTATDEIEDHLETKHQVSEEETFSDKKIN